MPINFPNSPSPNQQYTYDNKTWEWNGIYWEVYSALTSYITSAYTVGDGVSDISGVTGGNIALKSFSGVNITIIDSGDKLTFSGYPEQNVTGLYLPLSGGTVTGGTIFQSGLTVNGNLTATTISATTYQNLPSSQTTYVFNMNSYAVPNSSLFYGIYLGGTPVTPPVVSTQYGSSATEFHPGYVMPAGTASTLTVILRIAQVAPTSVMYLKLANTSTSTFGPVITIAAGSAAGTYTDNSATVSFTTNQRLTIVASNPFVAGATAGPQLTTGSFKYRLS